MSKFAGLGLAVDTPARMFILHPVSRRPLVNAETGEQAWIDLLSASSQAGRAHDRTVTDKQIKMRGQRLRAEDIESDFTEKLARLTKGWLLVTLEGVPLEVEFSLAAARELYAMPELSWLRDQVAEFAAELGNYPAAASTS